MATKHKISANAWRIIGIACGLVVAAVGEMFFDGSNFKAGIGGEGGANLESSVSMVTWIGFGIALTSGATFIGAARRKIKGD